MPSLHELGRQIFVCQQEKSMKANVGGLDRAARITAGVVLVA
ncbi:MAG: DUF2892 domain-containing protein, partial [Aquabacterium sp.]|nr:DUF2892 domain-containing protein [Aquabacterium sp.]